jgi:hypothetical protein
MAISLARFIALDNFRWCRAHSLEILAGSIFPRSLVKPFNSAVSMGSICVTLF